MFDTININLRSIDTQQLNFVKTVTRDLNVDTTTSRYGTTYTSHIDNLTIRTTTQGVSIGNGSLCKFLHGNNIVNFTRTDTRLAFEKLSDTLHVSLNNATVSRMDVAYNFDVTYPPESYFYHLGNLPYYKRLEQMFYKGVEGLYYSSVSDKKQLVFYDKIKETTNRKDYVPPEYQNKNRIRNCSIDSSTCNIYINISPPFGIFCYLNLIFNFMIAVRTLNINRIRLICNSNTLWTIIISANFIPTY